MAQAKQHSIFYFLQLLFDKSKQRDATYGNEFLALQLNPSFALKDGYDVLFREKGTHSTGAKRYGLIEEKLPTINLVVQSCDDLTLEHLILGNMRIGEKRQVTSATVTIRDRSHADHYAKSMQELLGQRCDYLGLSDLNLQSYPISNSQDDRLVGQTTGSIPAAVNFYHAAKALHMGEVNISFG